MKLLIQKWFMTQNNFLLQTAISNFLYMRVQSTMLNCKKKKKNINNCSSFSRIDGTDVTAQCISELTDTKLIADCCLSLSTMF